MRRLVSPLFGLLRWFAPWFRSPSAPGMLLFGAALVAFAVANSPWGEAYHHLLEHPLKVGIGPVGLEKTLIHWVNDGLMAVFFLLVGLEVKRELLTGQLSSLRRAALPVVAAVGGMVVPALLYLLLAGSVAPSGWGVPMATDIAFALGVLALLRSRAPPGMVVFLTAFAVADDVGAVLVIALFYTRDLALGPLAVAAGATALLVGLNRMGVRGLAAYLLVGLVLWVAVLKSGVHATIAGLVTALTVPHDREGGHGPLITLEHRLAPWVAWGILPVFALANAGVTVGGEVSPLAPVALGVSVGLVVGKLVGVAGASWVAVRLGVGELPDRVGPLHLAGLGLLGGIGFTMAIFIANLAYADPVQAETAKVGVLTGSLVAALLGSAVLYLAGSGEEAEEAPAATG